MENNEKVASQQSPVASQQPKDRLFQIQSIFKLNSQVHINSESGCFVWKDNFGFIVSESLLLIHLKKPFSLHFHLYFLLYLS
jgi:hypothetical protein